MASLTTEQEIPFKFEVKDGRGRVVAVDMSAGGPAAASSDETVATVSIAAGTGNSWDGLITSVAPGSCRIVVSADADLGEGIETVTGVLDPVDVTLDPRTGARMVELTPGEPVDKPA